MIVMREHGISPIIATVILIGLVVVAATPLAIYFAGYYSPVRPRRTLVDVYAGLINENHIMFHIQHVGGETIYFEEGKPTTDDIIGEVVSPDGTIDNVIYCWTFEDPDDFRQSDWAYAEVQLHGADLRIGLSANVRIVRIGYGAIFSGPVTIDDIGEIPG